ncbi:MAG: hypothetical protein QXV17_07775 [Candidatus Micrarchaeaceae archaeon]
MAENSIINNYQPSVPIIKGNVRILRPIEYEILRSLANYEKTTLMDCHLLTGMRYEELLRFRKHPEWWDEKQLIFLPEWAQKKWMRKQKQRVIRLSIKGGATIPHLFRIKMPQRTAYDQWLRRISLKAWQMYGLRPDGISSKSFRKTYESWLMFYYPNHVEEIYLSQGHDKLTSLAFYSNPAFYESDKLAMKPYVEGWI